MSKIIEKCPHAIAVGKEVRATKNTVLYQTLYTGCRILGLGSSLGDYHACPFVFEKNVSKERIVNCRANFSVPI
jgi:hypothetical protein